jgi:hypothetical protein
VKKRLFLLAVGMWVASKAWNAPEAAGRRTPSPDRPGSVSPDRTVLNQYCVSCHNQRSQIGKDTRVMLDTLDPGSVADSAETWERVVRKLRTRAMPPQGARRPDEATYDHVIASLETALDRAAVASPHPGRPVLHRLNRAEYANAVRDLLDLDVDVASLLPPDDSAYGFDNISDVLGVSPSLQERYLSAAGTISGVAVGDPAAGPVTETFRVRQDLSQNQHIEGMPLGTMGGILIRHTFPVDGEYDVRLKFFRTNFGNLRGLEHPHAVELAFDGRRIRLVTIGGEADLKAAFEQPTETADAVDGRFALRLPVTAGPHTITVAFVENIALADTTRLQPYLRSSYDTLDWTGRPHLDRVTITGPFDPEGAARDTASRRRVFVCRPASVSAELPCARQIITALLRRAYRQPTTDADLRPVVDFYQAARREGTFDSGIQAALQLILASPKFVFRVERDPERVPAGGVYRISDLELASRLSFFLWSSIPDDELLREASQDQLKDEAVLAHQVRRMLTDPKAGALVTNFAGQWLQLRNLKSFQPNSDEFPDFDDNLRQAFQRETELFFESIIREDRNVLDLMSADYTFVNERLARHYGLSGVYGSRFRRVMIADEARKGLLGKGAILAVTSHATRTSPVVRGKWILENILGTPPAPPPPDVPALKENEQGAVPRTVREQMAEHRANPVCASCHKVMDPLGFALENFDAVGAWRTREAGGWIDASGELADGTRVDGVVTLRHALLRRPDVFVTTLTEKMLTYALGRGLDYHDMPAVRGIVREAAGSHYRFSSLVLSIVNSVPFQMRKAREASDN